MKLQLLKLIGIFVFFSVLSFGQEVSKQSNPSRELPKELVGIPGVELSRSISHLTGLAINPLMVAGGFGALRYYDTPLMQRESLPFYASPIFWVPSLIIGVIFFLGGFVPILKKLLKSTEITINKVSPFLVAIPFMMGNFSSFIPDLSTNQTFLFPSTSNTGMVCMLPLFFSIATALFLILLCISLFFFVWLFIEAINALMLLSPNFLIDWILNIIKYSTLAIIFITSSISPYLSLAICAGIILLSLKISGWCFRFTLFGTVFAWDIISIANKRYHPNSQILAFSVQKFKHLPKRTLGSLSRSSTDESLLFSYRPWLLFPKRHIAIETKTFVIEKGIVFPSLCENDQKKRIFDFPPRCRSHEKSIATQLSVNQVLDSVSIKGIKAAIKWLKELLPNHETEDIYSIT